jgi:hypothetical protein
MKTAFGIAAFGLVVALSATTAAAQTAGDGWWDDEGVRYFHTAVADYYDLPADAPPPPRYIQPDELPVVHLLAREAGVSPEVVMALREQGWSWVEITEHLGVDPYVYVERLPRRSDYWGWHDRDYRHLTDRHIIDFVNLVFWASYYHRPVTQVIVVRQRVPSWIVYVRYHAPPRVVYVRDGRRWAAPPRWVAPPRVVVHTRRYEPVRRAVPHTTYADTRARPSSRPSSRPLSRPEVRRDAPPLRRDQPRGEARGEAPAVRRDDPATRRARPRAEVRHEAPPAQRETPPLRRDPLRRDPLRREPTRRAEARPERRTATSPPAQSGRSAVQRPASTGTGDATATQRRTGSSERGSATARRAERRGG